MARFSYRDFAGESRCQRREGHEEAGEPVAPPVAFLTACARLKHRPIKWKLGGLVCIAAKEHGCTNPSYCLTNPRAGMLGGICGSRKGPRARCTVHASGSPRLHGPNLKCKILDGAQDSSLHVVFDWQRNEHPAPGQAVPSPLSESRQKIEIRRNLCESSRTTLPRTTHRYRAPSKPCQIFDGGAG